VTGRVAAAAAAGSEEVGGNSARPPGAGSGTEKMGQTVLGDFTPVECELVYSGISARFGDE